MKHPLAFPAIYFARLINPKSVSFDVNYAALTAAPSEQTIMDKIRNTYTTYLKCKLKIKKLCVVPVDIRENNTMPVELFIWQIIITLKYYRQKIHSIKFTVP